MSENENFINENEQPAESVTAEEQAQIHIEETTTCKYCGRELPGGYEFCTFCGKSQEEIPLPVKRTTTEKRTPPVIKAKKKNTLNTVLFILSMLSFAVALVFFAIGMISWASAGVIGGSQSMFGNIFGSSDSSIYIINLTTVVASYFSSVIFMLTGIVFLMFRNKK